MIQLTEDYVKATAFNDSAFSNAKKLASGGKIVHTHITKKGDLLFGECLGSGKSNYVTSVDFMNEAEPVFRCSCPSRQIPCKHASGLLYAYYLKPETFSVADIPEDILSKRAKIEKRAEKKKVEQDQPKKVNVSAFVKKMKTQLEGIGRIEQFISESLNTGLASLPLNQIRSYQKELVKELGNYYIPSYQGKVEVILHTLEKAVTNETEEKEIYLKKALREMSKLMVLIKKSKQTLSAYIEAKKAVDAEAADIFTKMGYVWKLDELKQLGFLKENRQLIQLGFYQYDDEEEKALVDVGYYVDLEEAPIYKTLNIRPYNLLKRLKAEDTTFEVVQTQAYGVYPGEMNKRIRWEGCTTAPVTKKVLEKIRAKAQSDFKAVLKAVKNQLKDPLADEHPAVLLKYKALKAYSDQEGNRHFGIVDDLGETILIDEVRHINMPKTLCCMQYVLGKEELEDNVMLGVFEYQGETNRLVMQPISVITPFEIKRLLG